MIKSRLNTMKITGTIDHRVPGEAPVLGFRHMKVDSRGLTANILTVTAYCRK